MPNQNISFDSTLNSYFDQYNVTTFKQALPFAKHPDLLNLYEIECNCDLAEFYADLPSNIKVGIPHFAKDAIVDTGMVGNPIDWYYWRQKNDTTFDNMWYLDIIEADNAWNITTGDTNITVAVLDYKIDITHPDLTSEILLPHEPTDPNQVFGCIIPSRSMDGHGTAVSSLVSAETTDSGSVSNGSLAAIGYNTKMYFYSDGGWRFQLLQRSLHASSVLGANVIVACANAATACAPYPPSIPHTEDLIVKEILDNGTSIVAPAGNGDDGRSCGNSTNGFRPFYPFHPSYDDRIIVVSSTGRDDKHYQTANGTERTFSHFPEVDVCAPAYDLMIATPTYCDTSFQNIYYGFAFGTSFAAPMVAGLVSLMYSINPCLSAADVESILKSTTDPVVDAANYPGMVGTGRVNAYKAVKKARDVKSQSVDLYIKDRSEDVGLSGGYHWQAKRDNSPDIWVRNQNDGFTNYEHQDPEYSSTSPVYVYVRVRNKSCTKSSSQETLRLYWSKASSWSSWPQNWDGTQPLIGNVIDSIVVPPLAAGRDTILEFEWDILNPHIHNNWATCLLARIEDNPIDPITVYHGRIDDDVYFNNNIAMKNLTVIDSINGLTPIEVDEVLYPPGRYMFVGNPTNQTETFDFVFSENTESYESASLLDEAEIKIIMDNQGWSIIYPIIQQTSGIEQLNDEENSFIITDSLVTISNVEFPSNTRIPIYVGFSFLTEAAENEYFEYGVRQFNTEGDPLGGEYFEISRKERSEFYADAGNDQTIKFGETANLDATSIGEPAVYKWFDEAGNIYQGMSVNVEPTVDTEYLLEVTSVNDGYKDYDEVNVFVQHNWIDQITPNPATNNFTVDYIIQSGTTASIMILNIAATYQQCYTISPSNNQVNINLASYTSGTYNVILIVDGVAEDVKSLIVQ